MQVWTEGGYLSSKSTIDLASVPSSMQELIKRVIKGLSLKVGQYHTLTFLSRRVDISTKSYSIEILISRN
jgi:hypothetical protein